MIKYNRGQDDVHSFALCRNLQKLTIFGVAAPGRQTPCSAGLFRCDPLPDSHPHRRAAGAECHGPHRLPRPVGTRALSLPQGGTAREHLPVRQVGPPGGTVLFCLRRPRSNGCCLHTNLSAFINHPNFNYTLKMAIFTVILRTQFFFSR